MVELYDISLKLKSTNFFSMSHAVQKLTVKKMSDKANKIISCPIFGRPKDLNTQKLPTYSDVIIYFVWCEYKKSFHVIAAEIIDIWRPTMIPIVTKQTVIKRILSYHKEYRKAIKSAKSAHRSKEYTTRQTEFRKMSNKLFDIASCS